MNFTVEHVRFLIQIVLEIYNRIALIRRILCILYRSSYMFNNRRR